MNKKQPVITDKTRNAYFEARLVLEFHLSGMEKNDVIRIKPCDNRQIS